MTIPPAKKLGQHFLTNPRVIARIADATLGNAHELSLRSPKGEAWVAEIGPGMGALTSALLQRGAHVLAIEMDTRCIPHLHALSERHQNRLTVIEGDALTLPSWLSHLPAGAPICGNLPYNVGTEIVIRLLTAPYGGQPSIARPTRSVTGVAPLDAQRHPREGGDPRLKPSRSDSIFRGSQLTFMLQKEVVLRLIAKEAEDHRGRLAVLTHLLSDAKRLFDVGPGNFNPPPKVMSSIVQLTPLPKPRYDVNLKKLDTLLRTAFGQRRKMLRASLKPLLTEAQIAQTGIQPTARPEDLTTEALVRLASILG